MQYLFRISGLLIVLLVSTVIAGCSNTDDKPQGNVVDKQVIRYNIGAEPETLDPARAFGTIEATLIVNMFDGLTRYDKDQQIQPAIAKSWEISPDGKIYTFKLREARWSNGDPVTAEDFVYAWLRVLDPKTASDYAYQLYYIKGAENYNSGSGKAEDVGIRALDSHTLQVELNAPSPQFLGLTAFHTYFPVNKKIVNAHADWAESPSNYICNGPFKLMKWEHNQKITLAKNENYWDTGAVKLQELQVYLIDSSDTGYIMYARGELDFQDDVPGQEMEQLKESGELKFFSDAGTYLYRFNTTRKPFDDARVRRALAMAVDRRAIVENITKGGEKPAYAFVPYGFKDYNGGDFRENAGNLFKENIEEARKLLAQAGYPGGKGFPVITVQYNTHQMHAKIAQVVQQMWKNNLGIEVKLANMDYQVYLDAEDNLDYDISRGGWGPDYLDPMSFIDVFVTEGGNNDTGWGNQEYDSLVKQAKNTSDPEKRMRAMHRAEEILMREMPVMPLFFYTNTNLIKNNIKGVIIPSFNIYADFKNAYVEQG